MLDYCQQSQFFSVTILGGILDDLCDLLCKKFLGVPSFRLPRLLPRIQIDIADLDSIRLCKDRKGWLAIGVLYVAEGWSAALRIRKRSADNHWSRSRSWRLRQRAISEPDQCSERVPQLRESGGARLLLCHVGKCSRLSSTLLPQILP
jgi:hypothetical protein